MKIKLIIFVSVNTQAVVWANLMILDLVTGYPGSFHDSRVLRNSNIFRMAENGDVLSCPNDITENARTSLLILGDRGNPLMKWLVTPYSFSDNLTVTEKKLNEALSSARVTSECPCRMLKARWRYLQNNLDCQIENVSTVIIAYCVLHNICQLNKDDYIDNDGMLEAVIRQERNARRRRRNSNHAPVNAINSREAIKLYIMNNDWHFITTK